MFYFLGLVVYDFDCFALLAVGFVICQFVHFLSSGLAFGCMFGLPCCFGVCRDAWLRFDFDVWDSIVVYVIFEGTSVYLRLYVFLYGLPTLNFGFV